MSFRKIFVSDRRICPLVSFRIFGSRRMEKATGISVVTHADFIEKSERRKLDNDHHPSLSAIAKEALARNGEGRFDTWVKTI